MRRLALLLTVSCALLAARDRVARADDAAPGIAEFLDCGKLPAGKRVVKLRWKTQVTVRDLLGAMSLVSCTPLMISPDVPLDHPVNVVSPAKLTPEESYAVLLAALGDLGLTLESRWNYLRVIKRQAPPPAPAATGPVAKT
jgi:hypothetical protein